MSTRWKRWWPLVKVVLTVLVLAAVGWSFARDLRDPELWRRSFQPGWLVVSGLLYLLGLGLWCLYWHRLLVRLGQRPHAAASLRAYYVSHLGKYVPGKALTLVLRAGLASSPTVRPGLAGMCAFYEVLTTMAAGAILAGVLFVVVGPVSSAGLDGAGLWGVLTFAPPTDFVLGRWAGVAVAGLLLLPVGLPLLPPLFSRLAEKVSRPFRGQDAAPLPRLTTAALGEGLVITALGWLLLGASFWAALQAVAPGLAWSPALAGRMTAALAVAYVGGFVFPFTSGGLGVREYILRLLLAPELAAALPLDAPEAPGLVALAVLVLRLTWTVAEVVMAACVWWWPAGRMKP
jgi:uncharacterized membrane protein YbhN (UPF0104 family)